MFTNTLLSDGNVCNGSDARKLVSGEKLQGGATSRRNVRYCLGLSKLFHGSHTISASNNCNGSLVGKIFQDVNEPLGCLIEGSNLEHSHGTVEDNLGTRSKSIRKESNSLWSSIKSHPAIFDSSSWNHIKCLCFLQCHWFARESWGTDRINREYHCLSLFLCFRNKVSCSIHHGIFTETVSNRNSLSLCKREGKSSSKHENINLANQTFDNGKLCRNLTTSNDCTNLFVWFLA
mmetsp:Transcript_29423/g.53223  ORF Transcript_29423/g.53223 Transcript_29423/m.53223 type:complete len:233 (-) Transcript_29423:678-1376(-)